MYGWTARLLTKRWQRGRIGAARVRFELTNCVFHDNALRPRACPFPEHPALISTVLNTGYKTPFRLLVICREQERKLIKAIHILVKNLAKIFASRVLIFTVSKYLSVSLLSHSSTSRDFQLAAAFDTAVRVPGTGVSSFSIARSIVWLISETTVGMSCWLTSPTSETALLHTIVPVSSLVIWAETATSTFTPPS